MTDRRIKYRKRGFASGEVEGVLYEKHGAGPSVFVVVRGQVDVIRVCKALGGKVPAGTPILRLADGEEIEIWDEQLEK
jgi:hypothetical protein